MAEEQLMATFVVSFTALCTKQGIQLAFHNAPGESQEFDLWAPLSANFPTIEQLSSKLEDVGLLEMIGLPEPMNGNTLYNLASCRVTRQQMTDLGFPLFSPYMEKECRHA